MLRQALTATQSLVWRQAFSNQYRAILSSCGRDFRIQRHFSSGISEDWPEAIKDFLRRERINEPTNIQEKTLPFAMQNKDIVGIARTGSGKTLAFVLPAIAKILKERELNDTYKQRAPTCLVVAPTRELAHQTHEVFSKFRGIRSIALIGGKFRATQLRELASRDHDVYIATPGRLNDLQRSGEVDLSNIKYLVLDEADRMLDMGFEPQIRDLIAAIPSDRQTLMFSATWPREIQSLAEEFTKDHEYVAVDSEKLKANPNIKQLVEVCASRDKFNILLDHLSDFQEGDDASKTLIFVNTKRMVETLMFEFTRNRIPAIILHGGISQNARDSAIKRFKSQYCRIMIATDVASRGLDINDVTHIINYDMPQSIEDYIHRIGRTARHDRQGTSLTLLGPQDAGIVPKLMRVLAETDQEIPESLKNLADDTSFSRGSSTSFNKRSNYRFRSSFRREDQQNHYGERQRSGSFGRNQRYNSQPSGRVNQSDAEYEYDDYDTAKTRYV